MAGPHRRPPCHGRLPCRSWPSSAFARHSAANLRSLSRRRCRRLERHRPTAPSPTSRSSSTTRTGLSSSTSGRTAAPPSNALPRGAGSSPALAKQTCTVVESARRRSFVRLGTAIAVHSDVANARPAGRSRAGSARHCRPRSQVQHRLGRGFDGSGPPRPILSQRRVLRARPAARAAPGRRARAPTSAASARAVAGVLDQLAARRSPAAAMLNRVDVLRADQNRFRIA